MLRDLKTPLRLLAAFWLATAPAWAADPGGLDHFKKGVALEKAKQVEAAAAEYQACLDQDPSYAPAMKQLGNCLYAQQIFPGALKEYEDYLKLQPGDQKTANFAKYLRDKIGASAKDDSTATGPGSNLDKHHRLKVNPRDNKHLQLLLGLGRFDIYHFDISYFTSRNNNFGLSYSQVPTGASAFSLFEPRYRRYMADWYVAPFVEGGILFGSTTVKSGSFSTDFGFFGAVLGFGVNAMFGGAWTTEFALSYPMGTISYKSQNNGYDDYNYMDQDTWNSTGSTSIWGLPIPMPSFSFGFIF